MLKWSLQTEWNTFRQQKLNSFPYNFVASCLIKHDKFAPTIFQAQQKKKSNTVELGHIMKVNEYFVALWRMLL